MRVAGLAMIVLGLIGLGISVVDWDTIGGSQTADETASNGTAVDQHSDEQISEEKTLENDKAENESPKTVDNERPEGPIEEPGQAQETAGSNGVAETGPANVKVFDRDEQPDPSKPTLWAEISASSEIVNEDSGHANFLVTLSEPTTRSVVIIFSTVDLSANDQEDYQSQRGTVTFEPGVVSAEIKTPLVDDDIKEDDEQFAIVLNGAPGIVNFKSRRITTTIRDDD